MEDETFSIEVLIFATALAIYILVAYLIKQKQLTFLHESAVAILLGFISALFIKVALSKEVTFSYDFFFSLLLPPIVFSVGYSIKKPQFFQHFLSIVFFGIISTLLAITMQTGVLSLLNEVLFDDLSPKDILLITIVTSSSDPITALPLLKSQSHKLNAMVSGQSVLNSAVVIILFQIISGITFANNSIQTGIILRIIVDFAYIFFCSLILGIIFGLGLSYLFKKVPSFSQHHIKETSLILLIGYVVYLMGEFCGLSGIMALFTCSIIFSKYGFNNLSQESKQGTELAFDSIRYIFQAFIFAYLGATLLTIHAKWSALGISLTILLLIPLIRFLSVSILPLLFKIIGRPFPLGRAERKLFWYTGLIRGIISFALSLQIVSKNRSYLRTVSLIVVMITTVLGSTFLNRFCQAIGLGNLGLMKTGDLKEEERQIELMPSTKYGVIGTVEEVKQSEPATNAEKLSLFEEKYIKPFFVREPSATQKLKESKRSNGSQ